MIERHLEDVREKVATQSREIASLRAEVRSLRADVALVRAENPRKLNPLPLAQVQDIMSGVGFEQSTVLEASPGDPGAFKKRSVVIVCPTRGSIDSSVVEAWNAIIFPMNAPRTPIIFARNFEVATAYNRLIEHVTEHPYLSTWNYVLCLEDDNIPPPEGLMQLFDAMERARTEDGKSYDAVAGLYHCKNAAHMPMAYGLGKDYRKTGEEDCRVLGHNELVEHEKDGVVEVLGIPQGFTLLRMSIFKDVPRPWYATLDGDCLVDGKDIVPHAKIRDDQVARAKRCMTQDLFFSVRAVRQGKRLGVVPGVRVGHLDVGDGLVY